MASRGSTAGEPLASSDRPNRAHYLIAIGMGATVGTLAAFGESLYVFSTFPVFLFNRDLSAIVIAVAIAPLVEEPAKSLGLLLLKEEEKLVFSVQSWTILGSLAGVGFGFLENVVYAYSVGHFGLDVSLTLFLMRGLLTAPLHGITATLTGFGIGLWQKTGNPRLLILPMIVAMMIHGSFNLLASLV
ncbi:PrsW family intramembrane metalloprotease [Candidatus Bathyarchaeota archaeon]|nr:MAG: PrsW family intramembrane metalloprotease [Candidatus Bathyarchaeota archaeon]TMI29433.1 MAG: PrsW family intramembrane metalloprotease [Candidatus Bathyarchaeota archaeon]